MVNGREYHWKHGWIPLDHAAAVSKFGSAGAEKRGFSDKVAGMAKGAASAKHADDSKFPAFPEPPPMEIGKQYRELNAQGGVENIRKNSSVTSYLGAGYEPINGGLRGTKPLSPVASQQVYNIDKAFERDGVTLKEDRVFQRGAGLAPGVNYEPGAIAVEAGYTSVTMDPGTSQAFKNNEWGTSKDSSTWLFDVKVPAGSRVLVPDNPLQSEVMLPRNASYRIVSVDHATRKIQMEFLP